MDFFSNFFSNEITVVVLPILFQLVFVAIPIFLLLIVWDLWVVYRRSLYFSKQTYLLLEIKLPKEIFKSPKAMEFCIDGLHSTLKEANWFEKYWEGKVRDSYSLEIASIDGAVHFYIWCRKGDKNKIEANLYSQYPGVEINVAPDYTLPVSFNPDLHGMWVTEFKLTKADAFPIKTYVDYGLEKDPKEEVKIDPVTPFIEFLGSLNKGHQAWLQIIVRAHKAEQKDPKKNFFTWKIWETWSLEDVWDFQKRKDLMWEENAKDEIEKMIVKSKGEKDKEGKIIPGTVRMLTEDEQNIIKALGRSISKKGFDVGMRMIYTAPKDIFDMANVGGLVGGIMHFNSPMNGFAPAGTTSPKYKHFLLSWKDRNKELLNGEKQEFLDAYKRRAYFYKPYRREKFFVLNTEELATIFHLPGQVSATPTFNRIESRKGEAPSNLPI